jgi:SH3-like domain-containing protein
MTRTLILLCVAFTVLAVSQATAGPSHFASIRRDRAYLREGPSYAHKVLWIYQRRYYPVQVVGIFDAWRRVIDVDGTVGWMHHTQLSDIRTVLFVRRSVMRFDAAPASKIVAYAQAGVVARLRACKLDRCEVEASDVDGWVDKKNIWGVDASDVF